ncbi:MAG: JAB domain-containing protein, partial [Hyphomonadaceae bacterium]|nr:JAB domain-containing protein [Hyphomonadaceae bacterium]
FCTRLCKDVIERVLHVLSVMIASGLNQTIPNHGALSAYVDTFAQVIQRQATSSGFLHNHPSGDPKPSPSDVAITKEIVAAADAVGVKVHDHLVIGRNGAASFKAMGLI